MTRAPSIIHRQTIQRAERLRLLVSTLMQRDLPRDEIGEILQLGPSGIRKYVKDLDDGIEIARYIDGTATFIGFPVYRLAMTMEAARAYLGRLAAAPTVRPCIPSDSVLNIAARDPSRHFHILADDTHYAIRVSRSPVARDPLVAAFFGTRAPMEVRHVG